MLWLGSNSTLLYLVIESYLQILIQVSFPQLLPLITYNDNYYLVGTNGISVVGT